MSDKKSNCLLGLFWASVTCFSLYLLYVAIGVPVQLNNHRLRSHPLKPFQLYTLSDDIWNEKNIPDQGLSVITYESQKLYDYRYELGIFVEDSSDFDSTNSSLISLTWSNFTTLVEEQYSPQIFIFLWSFTHCNQSLVICFQDEYFPTNSTYYHTNLDNTQHFNIDVDRVSRAIDIPRDPINFIVIAAFLTIVALLLASITDPQDASFFYIALVLIAVYYLYVLALSVIPIGFCLPYDVPLDYWSEIRDALTITVGEYKAGWWVSGVMLHGIWMYTLLLFLPVMCCCFMLLVACAECFFVWCCPNKVDDVGLWIMVFVIGTALCAFFFMSIGFICVFIGNMTMWNQQTYNAINDPLVIQTLVALFCACVILPIFGGVAVCNANKITKDQNKPQRPNRFGSFSRSFGRLPSVRKRREKRKNLKKPKNHKRKRRKRKKKKHYDESDRVDAGETVAMTQQQGDKQRNVVSG